jgi:hypothetical protein
MLGAVHVPTLGAPGSTVHVSPAMPPSFPTDTMPPAQMPPVWEVQAEGKTAARRSAAHGATAWSRRCVRVLSFTHLQG